MGRQRFEGRSAMTTGLNVWAHACIGSSFGRLVPLGSVGSPIIAIINVVVIDAGDDAL